MVGIKTTTVIEAKGVPYLNSLKEQLPDGRWRLSVTISDYPPGDLDTDKDYPCHDIVIESDHEPQIEGADFT